MIFDWNTVSGFPSHPPRPLALDDETLRDGLQSASCRQPSLEEKAELIRLMPAAGITCADLGLPGASPAIAADVEALCRVIQEEGLPLEPNCAARTVEEDIVPVLEMQQRLGMQLEIMLFMGSSPLRAHIEGWDPTDLLARTVWFVSFAVGRGAKVTFVTEDTSRSQPEDLRMFYQEAVRSGAHRVCVADTAGFATPIGAYRLVEFVGQAVREAGGPEIGVDWHGHNDRGLAVVNALAAALAGADRLHGTALGVGERTGNPAMEQLLVNLKLLGWGRWDLRSLPDYVEAAARLLGREIPPGAPAVGGDAFRTSTGVHASAILKAQALGATELADLVYSSVPAAWLGRRQTIDIGPMSGAANVKAWMRARGIPERPGVVARVLELAKRTDRVLTDDEVAGAMAGES